MRKLYIVMFCLFLANGFNSAFAQEADFQKAKFRKTIEEARKALGAEPARGDLMVVIANNYAWQEKTDSALIYLEKAKQINYYNDDLFDSWLNVLLWSHRYESLLETCRVAEQYKYSHTENLLRKKMLAYTELRDYDEGIELFKAPGNKEFLKLDDISYMYNNLIMKRNTNVVQAFYSIDCFDHNAPQHLANLGYAFKVGKHSLALRANYADRYHMNDVLLESDFYLQMNNKSYMYFNYGYAFDASLFPRHRAGYEYYMPLEYKMEASLGARYMKYISSEVFIATGHLEKYMGNHWVAFRPFYVMQDNGNSFTLLANYRFYGKNPLNYWGVELTYGNSPDDSRATMENSAFNNLDAYKIKLERSFMLNSISDVRIGIGYTREEYITSKFRNRYLIEVGYRFRLR
nr:YaiO family outer membrane beta-barrel protein [uncultured Bacteroides sp.]